jgi:hypothetical protein
VLQFWASPSSEGRRLWLWQGARPGRLGRVPDAVTDTTRRRKVKAKRLAPILEKIRAEATRRGSDGYMVMLTAPLTRSLESGLYSIQAAQAARELVKALAGGWPAWYTLEQGKGGGLHVHILTVIDAVPGLPEPVHGEPVYSLAGVLAYLAKVRDALAACSNWCRAVSTEAGEVAAERYLSARAGRLLDGFKQLPRASGVLNMPRRKAAPLPCVLSVLDAEDKAARRARWKAVIASRRSRRQSVPRVPRRAAQSLPARPAVPSPAPARLSLAPP